MKIEFEIDENEASILIDALQFAASQSNDQATFEAIQKVIQDIQEDLKNGVLIFEELKRLIKPYTDGSAILKTSSFRTQLGLSQVFIESSQGLIYILNYILNALVALHEPGTSVKNITMQELSKAKKIKDLIDLIQSNYEDSN